MRTASLLAAAAAAACAASASGEIVRVEDSDNTRCDDSRLSLVEHLLVGSCARVVAQGVLHPIDVVRTRVQARKPLRWTPGEMLRGIGPNLVLAGPAGAIQFGALSTARAQLAKLDNLPETAVELLAGVAGAGVAGLVRIPQEVVKQGCQAGTYDNALEALSVISAQSGVRGFYKGAAATLVRDIGWNSLSYAFFKVWRKMWAASNGGAAPSEGESAALGLAAGMLAAVATHPVDVIKTRIMVGRAGETSAYAAMNPISALFALVKAEGLGALTMGLLPRLVYLGPLASIMMSVREATMGLLIGRKPGCGGDDAAAAPAAADEAAAAADHDDESATDEADEADEEADDGDEADETDGKEAEL